MGPPLEPPEGVCLLTPRFQTSAPQSWERMGFSVVIHAGCGHGLWRPRRLTHIRLSIFLLEACHGLPHCSRKEGKDLCVLFAGRAQCLPQRQL